MSAHIELKQIGVIAAKEFRDHIRNRWVLGVALVFTAFALVIAYFGSAQQGAVGLRHIDVTIASLVSLVIYLVPLVALLLGYDAIVGERERGSLELLLSMPLTRLELLLGKYAGLALALVVSTWVGFGACALLLVRSRAVLLQYAGFIGSATLLGLAFLSLAVMISALARDRVRASGIAIGVWFFFVLIYDLLLLGVLVASAGRIAAGWFPVLLLLNPADLFRVLNVYAFEDLRTMLGLATMLPPALARPWLLGGAMLLWIVAPLGVAIRRFR